MTTATLFPASICESFEDRDSWLAGRRSMIGASDTASIFNIGFANQSPITVWDSKVNDRPQELDPVLEKRFAIGTMMEPALRSIFAMESGLPCFEPGKFTIYRNAAKPWIGATLDGVTVHPEFGPCPVELKNVSNFQKHEWESESPLKYQVQVQHQMYATGASRAYLLGLIGGNDPIVVLIERNDKFIAAMLDKLAEFWAYVERKEMPPIDASEATAALLGQLWPHDSGLTVALPNEAAEWDRELIEAKDAIKAAEACKLAAENKIKAAIGEATFGLLPFGGQYSWKEQSRSEYVCKATSFRVLRRKD